MYAFCSSIFIFLIGFLNKSLQQNCGQVDFVTSSVFHCAAVCGTVADCETLSEIINPTTGTVYLPNPFFLPVN
jgi:hypothetical protein